MSTPINVSPPRSAVLDDAHLGDIKGALGTIAHHDTGARNSWWARVRTLLAILGPGLIVMVGDNDAGAFGTYTQAGQNYGTTLLWTMLLLVPVLFVNQEMVLRLGAVTGVGHARLIFERFGKFWGAFSVVDLFILNALTIVTEFIGITFVLQFFGISKVAGVCIAAAVTMAAVSTGNFRRFERFAVVLCLMSLLLVPVLVSIHPPVSQMAHDFLIPGWPAHSKLSDVMLLVIGIVGTTVAPWQLFFQQSYIVDKRITPRFMKYEKADLWIGIVFVMIGAVAMISFCAALYAGKPESGHFIDAGGVIADLESYAGRTPAVLFAVALLDACIIGAAAVSLSTAYAIGDVFKIRHSLHRGVSDAKGFYLVYFGIVAAAATLVLIPGSPLGLLTEAVQTLAGVLLPSATVFLLLLCNDRAVLGPWVNSKKLNVFTGAVVWVLVMLSIILTASVMYPDITGEAMLEVLAGGTLMAVAGYAATVVVRKLRRESGNPVAHESELRLSKETRAAWRMPPLDELPAPQLTMSKRVWMGVLRGYLIVAVALVIVKVVQMALMH
ncbi:divalent metal cation transporter [Paraburkholderia dipogonis]|uniref:Divalent metal cation transporter n=1 Tax=Paraburkholderia dipogonis TaxID=1211383 RepID=A0A4Y8MXF6_9BURK|nr:NRAMP family divalent metal transporter [Paraburkholderia dipogonis]TFE42089.1 divalent metal cation transporter [Paraburkholderia dipogonis]